MASITNTTITSYDYLLRQYYSSNRNARKTIIRGTMKTEDLVRADSEALKKVARNLKTMDYGKDNGVNIYNNVKAFVESYNNLFDSTDKLSSSSQLTRAEKKLKNYVKANKSTLEDIGIKVTSTGKLKLDKTDLLSSSTTKVKKVLSDKSEFTGMVTKYATQISRFAKNLRLSSNSAQKKKTAATNPALNLPVTTQTMTSNAIDFKA